MQRRSFFAAAAAALAGLFGLGRSPGRTRYTVGGLEGLVCRSSKGSVVRAGRAESWGHGIRHRLEPFADNQSPRRYAAFFPPGA